MKKLLEWIERKKLQHGNIVVLLSALVLFILLALLMALVYALVIGLIYIDPYLVLVLTFFLLILIIYKNRVR